MKRITNGPGPAYYHKGRDNAQQRQHNSQTKSKTSPCQTGYDYLHHSMKGHTNILLGKWAKGQKSDAKTTCTNTHTTKTQNITQNNGTFQFQTFFLLNNNLLPGTDAPSATKAATIQKEGKPTSSKQPLNYGQDHFTRTTLFSSRLSLF